MPLAVASTSSPQTFSVIIALRDSRLKLQRTHINRLYHTTAAGTEYVLLLSVILISMWRVLNMFIVSCRDVRDPGWISGVTVDSYSIGISIIPGRCRGARGWGNSLLRIWIHWKSSPTSPFVLRVEPLSREAGGYIIYLDDMQKV